MRDCFTKQEGWIVKLCLVKCKDIFTHSDVNPTLIFMCYPGKKLSDFFKPEIAFRCSQGYGSGPDQLQPGQS